MALRYDFHTSAELPKVAHLWREATDWGDQFDSMRRWYDSAPFGKLHIVTATKIASGEVVGQFCFATTRIVAGGREINAVRPFGTIVTPAMREAAAVRSPLDHPVIAMYSCGVRELKAAGTQLVYMVPDPRWLRLFKMFPGTQTGLFPLWSLSVPFAKPLTLSKGFTAAPLENWDERVERLWEKSSRLHDCLLVRNAAMLRWKVGNDHYTTIAVERDGELIGIVASRQKGDRQWLICDMLCADAGESMRATLAAASNVAHEKSLTGEGKKAIHKVAVLATPLMQPILQDLGFARDAYDFLVAVEILDKKIAAEDVAPARWYLSGDD